MQQIPAYMNLGGFVKAFSFLPFFSFLAEKKMCFTVPLIGSACVVFVGRRCYRFFNLIHFDWLLDNFPKCSDGQLIRGIKGCFAFPFEQASSYSSPAPTPTVHSNSKSNMAGQINDCELLTLARTNKTPALQASLILTS